MITQHATPPRFGTQPLDDGDDLFALIEQTCADCGQAFQSSRRAVRCATCASLRSGAVGPATVVCPVCGIEHQIPILKPHKLCLSCSVDLEMTLAAAQVRLDEAQAAWLAADERLQADYAHADERTQSRYDAALAMRRTGEWAGQTLGEAQRAALWERALTKGDELSTLLGVFDRAQAAGAARQQALAAVEAAQEAIEL